MEGFRPVAPTGSDHRKAAVLGVLCLVALSVPLASITAASASAFTGGLSPTIIVGKADLNGDGVVNGSDDANAFYGDTSIIDGKLDCDAWGAIANDGSAGDLAIDTSDDCSLVGYDGTPDGVTIDVVDGAFQTAGGPLPTVFNAASPADPSVVHADFAWSTLDGRVDSDGDGTITGDDCHFGLVGSDDVLGNPGGNECGFATPPNTADNGLVDLNGDADITSLDSCADGCILGHDVTQGKVQAPECLGFAGDPRNDVLGTPANDQLSGTPGADIVCSLGGNDRINAEGGADLVVAGPGGDVVRGGLGADTLQGNRGRDQLFGGPGNDRLVGGPGRDRCVGGRGADTFVSCESRRK
jgi:Ca2+-binding RTX toxin-like protein